MKKTIFIILGGVALAVVSLFLLDKTSKKESGFAGWLNGKKDEPQRPTDQIKKNYTLAKMNAFLSKGNENFPLEVELLQRFINLKTGRQTVPVNGIYDEITEKAVLDITGSPATSVFAFRSTYLEKEGMNEEAENIVKGVA